MNDYYKGKLVETIWDFWTDNDVSWNGIFKYIADEFETDTRLKMDNNTKKSITSIENDAPCTDDELYQLINSTNLCDGDKYVLKIGVTLGMYRTLRTLKNIIKNMRH